MKTSCRVHTDLSGLPRDALGLKSRSGVDGKAYFDLNYFLVLSTAEANLKFSVEIDGKEYSSVEATYV